MNKLKHGFVIVVGAIALFIMFVAPLIKLDIMLFGSDNSIEIGDIGTTIPQWVGPFFYAFPFFLTLIEFFFKKPILERRPYLYIIGFFILISFVDEKFLLATIVVVLLGALPGSVYGWVRDKRKSIKN